MRDRVTSAPPVGYARIAGLAYLLIILLGVVSVGVVDSGLIVAGDGAATAENITTNAPLFRLSVVAVLILYASVLVLSWALYVVLREVNEHLCLLALMLRSAEGILGAATAIISLIVLAALGRDGDSADAPHVQALVGTLLNARTAALDIVLIFVGVGGAVFCYLLFVSNLIPRILAAWGIATYVSMFGLALVSILWPEHPSAIETVLYGGGTLFEVSIGLWLLVRAIDVQTWQTHAGADVRAAQHTHS